MLVDWIFEVDFEFFENGSHGTAGTEQTSQSKLRKNTHISVGWLASQLREPSGMPSTDKNRVLYTQKNCLFSCKCLENIGYLLLIIGN